MGRSTFCPFCGSSGQTITRDPTITPRDASILEQLAQGASGRTAGRNLGISPKYFKERVHHLARKLRLDHSRDLRIQLAKLWSYELFRIGAGYQ